MASGTAKHKTEAGKMFNVGDTVKYASPLTHCESNMRFTVLENNGNRIKMQWNAPMTPNSRFYPVEVLAVGDIVSASDCLHCGEPVVAGQGCRDCAEHAADIEHEQHVRSCERDGYEVLD